MAGRQPQSFYQPEERVVYEFEDDNQLVQILDQITGKNWRVSRPEQPLFPTSSTHRQRNRKKNGVSALPFLLPHGDYGDADLLQIERNFARQYRYSGGEIAFDDSTPRGPQLRRRSRPIVREVNGSFSASESGFRRSYPARPTARRNYMAWNRYNDGSSTDGSPPTSRRISIANDNVASRLVEVGTSDPYSDDFINALVNHAEKYYAQYIKESGTAAASVTRIPNGEASRLGVYPNHGTRRGARAARGSYNVTVMEGDSDDEKGNTQYKGGYNALAGTWSTAHTTAPLPSYNATATGSPHDFTAAAQSQSLAAPAASPNVVTTAPAQGFVATLPTQIPTVPSSPQVTAPTASTQNVSGPIPNAQSTWNQMLRLHTYQQETAPTPPKPQPSLIKPEQQSKPIPGATSPHVPVSDTVPTASFNARHVGPFRSQVINAMKQSLIDTKPPPRSATATETAVSGAPTSWGAQNIATSMANREQAAASNSMSGDERKPTKSPPLGFGTSEFPGRGTNEKPVPLGFGLASGLDSPSLASPEKTSSQETAATSSKGPVPVSVIPLDVTSSPVDPVDASHFPSPGSVAGPALTGPSLINLPRPFDYGPFPQFDPSMVQTQPSTGPPINLGFNTSQSVTTNALLNLKNYDRVVPVQTTVVTPAAIESPKKKSFLNKLKDKMKAPLFGKKRQ